MLEMVECMTIYRPVSHAVDSLVIGPCIPDED